MPSRAVAVAASNGILNLTSLLRALPSTTSTIYTPSLLTRPAICLFSTTNSVQGIKRKRNKRRHIDPYRAAQALQRRSANIARQAILKKERTAAMGDLLRARPTSFIQSLSRPSPSSPDQQPSMNYLLDPKRASQQIAHSKWLTEPLSATELGRIVPGDDPQKEIRRREKWEMEHENAEKALVSITSLAQGSSKDRTRSNIQRCIEEFGRHRTDSLLPSKSVSLDRSGDNVRQRKLSAEEAAAAEELAAIPQRVGQDTGSSEVQVAILTAKINAVADNLGKKDKYNKRNLRLLVHRRQKLLTYLRRKERAGPRWQNLVEKLGINDAMWKGEITM